MKSWLPYSYVFRHIPRNRKRPVWEHGIDTVEVDVPEISRSDTDALVSVEYRQWRPDGEYSVPIEYRSWDGGIISPVTCDHHTEFPLDWLPTAPDRPSARPFQFRHLYGFSSLDEKLRRIQHYLAGNVNLAADRFHGGESALPDMIENRRDTDRVIVEKIAADLVAVDGRLWHKNEGLCLRLDTRELNGSYYLGFHPEPYGYLRGDGGGLYERGRYPGWTRTFDHSQIDRAKLHAGAHDVRIAFGSIEVFDDVSLSFDGERDFIVKAMDYAVIANAKTVGDMPGEAALAWTSLRAAVEDLREDASIAVSDDDIANFKTLADNDSCENRELVSKAFSACMDYLEDPWGRYGSRQIGANFQRTP
jgi:hypothetical protein